MRSSLLSLILLVCIIDLQARTHIVHAYRGYTQTRMQKMEIIGQVTSTSNLMTSKRQRILDYDNRENILSARLLNHESVRLGDKIYIIQKDSNHEKYKHGLIIGEAEVYSVFKTEFQGWILRAKGNLRLIKKSHFIAIPFIGNSQKEAYLLAKKGEKYETLGKPEIAYKFYRQSLEKDTNRPETYLRLAILSRKSKRNVEALGYLKQAWKRLNKIRAVSDILLMPGLYLKWSNEKVAQSKNQKTLLKNNLNLLDEIRTFQSKLTWFRHAFSSRVLKLIQRKGIPSYEFQFQKAEVYRQIYHILDSSEEQNTGYYQLLHSLTSEERKILYQPIRLLTSNSKVYPKKSGEEAFYAAAINHYIAAHELNRLDARASYEIINLCYLKIINDNPTPKNRERLVETIQHYAKLYLNLPAKMAKQNRIKNILKKVNG